MEEIIIATNNKNKVKEIQEMLQEQTMVSLEQAGISIEIEENEPTFEGNAFKKAQEITKLTGKPAIADDSGLCIQALQGFPGVNTKRFLGKTATDRQRNCYLLEQLQNITDRQKRKAEMVTCIAYTNPNGETIITKGVLLGYISMIPRGNNGFGFDEIFELEDGRTLAEISEKEKNEISSRKKALQELEQKMRGIE